MSTKIIADNINEATAALAQGTTSACLFIKVFYILGLLLAEVQKLEKNQKKARQDGDKDR